MSSNWLYWHLYFRPARLDTISSSPTKTGTTHFNVTNSVASGRAISQRANTTTTTPDCLLVEEEEILISVGSAQKTENLFVLKQRINNIGTKYWTTLLQSPHHHLNKPLPPSVWLPVFKPGSMSDEWNRYCGVWSMYYQVIVLWLILSACDGSEQLYCVISHHQHHNITHPGSSLSN